MIEPKGGQIDYIEIVDAETLSSLDTLEGRILVALAVFFGKALKMYLCIESIGE